MEIQLLKVPEIAKALQISRALAYRLITEGELPAVRFRRTVRVKSESLEAFIQKNSMDSGSLNGIESNRKIS